MSKKALKNDCICDTQNYKDGVFKLEGVPLFEKGLLRTEGTGVMLICAHACKQWSSLSYLNANLRKLRNFQACFPSYCQSPIKVGRFEQHK